MKYNIGDKIIVTSIPFDDDYFIGLLGKRGTIITLPSTMFDSFGIDFNEDLEITHNLKGKIEKPTCLFVLSKDFKHYTNKRGNRLNYI